MVLYLSAGKGGWVTFAQAEVINAQAIVGSIVVDALPIERLAHLRVVCTITCEDDSAGDGRAMTEGTMRSL